MGEERLSSIKMIKNTLMLIFAIVAGFILGRIFYLGLIPIALNFIIVGLVFSVAVIFAHWLMQFIKVSIFDCKKFGKYYKEMSKYILFGSIGTFLSTLIAVIYGVVAVSVFNSIIFGLAVFFFIIMIVSIISMIDYLIRR